MRIFVVPYDPAWDSAYERESGRIAAALGPVLVRMHHIGSTAIPGIHAKPVIDILLEVDHLPRLDAITPAIEALGYEAMGECGIPGRRYFRKDGPTGERTHNVHAFELDSPNVVRHLAFRDYMRAHPEEAARYGQLKQQLAQDFPEDIDGYMAGKDRYVKEQEARALAWYQGRDRG